MHAAAVESLKRAAGHVGEKRRKAAEAARRHLEAHRETVRRAREQPATEREDRSP